MAKPLAPGWYPDPNGKSGAQLYWDGQEWHTAPPPTPTRRRSKPSRWPWIIGGAVLLVILIGRCGGESNDRASQTSPSESPTQSAAPTSEQPLEHQFMPGNGTYNMGGMDGKDWGVWESSGGGSCAWSIRRVTPYEPGEVLDSGEAGPGEKARANIQPDGDVSTFTGEIDGHRLVFMTNGCGSWSFTS